MAIVGSVALGGQSGSYRDGWGTSGRSFSTGHRVPGPHLPERVRADPAVQRAGGRVHDPAPGQADPVAGADGADRDAVPPVGGVLCVLQRDPVGEVRQGRPEDRRDAAAHRGAGRDREVRGGGGRGLAGVPAGLVRLPARHANGSAAVHVREGRPQGDLLLLLPAGRGFRPAFIKVCAYFPYPAKIWVNGHEWAKRQALKAGIGFTALSNGFASCDDPDGLQAICDRLQPGTIEVFAQRWLHRLPMPFGRKDRQAGYWWETSMRQVEVSRTIVLDAPRRARAFFEALIADNLDIGRPASVEIIFGRKIRRDTPGVFRTTIDRPVIGPDTGQVVVNIFYKHSRVKQYLKDGRAMRIETVINVPRDLGCNARLPNLAELQGKARAVNRRILDAERAGQGTVLASPAFERIAHPSTDADGRRTPALRFGDPRVTALAGALCTTLLAANGVTNKSLRALMTGLLHAPYSPGQMTYDLRRLRLAGLIRRLEHTNRYVLTPDGVKMAIFYTKLHNRLLRPLLAADQPQAPPDLRQA